MMSEEEKEQLGDALYEKICEARHAGKLTGMMLDSQTADQVRDMLADDAVLKRQVSEALKCLARSAEEEEDDGVDWKAKAAEMQEELQQAEEWASDVQKDLDAWSEKERSWNKEREALKKESEELTRRLSRQEASAEDSKKSSDKVTELTKKADAARKQLSDVEKQKVNLEDELAKCKERTNELEKSLKKAEEAASQAQIARKEALAGDTPKADAPAEEKNSNEVSMADRMKADMLAKCKAELVAKEEENIRLKAELKQVSASVNANNGKHKNGSDLTGLEQKLQEAEAAAKANLQRATEADRRAEQAEEELEASRKIDRTAQSKADKSRELQQDLEQAHRDIKSFKTQQAKAQQEITELKKKLKGAGLIAESPKAAETTKKETPKQKESQVVAQPLEKVDEPEEQGEIEDDEPEPVEESSRKPVFNGTQSKPVPSKVQATAAAKSNGKKKGGAVPPPSPAVKTKKKSSFQCSGTHVVAGCLALVVMIQAGLFVYESLYGESLR
mmetsp:Transcript_28519/g.45888  ORF Transcript_28519/g.45888 Transcript_28519/m.45888 type:complete len:504 (+) Transcript_28519:136-1647(+)